MDPRVRRVIAFGAGLVGMLLLVLIFKDDDRESSLSGPGSGDATGYAEQDQGGDDDVRIDFVLDDGTPLSGSTGDPSSPRPVVILDSLLIDVAGVHPGRSIVRRTGVDRIQIRLSGTVYDMLADGVAEGLADIRTVTITSSAGGTPRQLSVVEVSGSQKDSVPPDSHADQVAMTSPRMRALRPFPFLGRFDSGLFDVKLSDASDLEFVVEAVNVAGEQGIATLHVDVEFDEGEYAANPYRGLEVLPQLYENIDPGTARPVLVHFNDPDIGRRGVHRAYAKVNGRAIPLRMEDGQLQLGVPLWGVYGKPPPGVPNIVQVGGEPDRFVIEYSGVTRTLEW